MMDIKLFCKLFLTPPGFNLALLTLTYLICWVSPRVGRRFVLYNILILYIFSTPLFFFNLLGRFEVTTPLTDFSQKADAIVLLSGGNWQSPEYGENALQPSPFALQRVKYAAYLYQKTKLPIIASGGVAKSPEQSESHIFATILKNDYKIEDVIEEAKSRNTNENALFTKKIAQDKNIKTIYLVTNAFHMDRATHIFKYYGFNVIQAPTGSFALQRPRKLIGMFIPSSLILLESQIMIVEILGKLSYKLAGHPF